MSLTEFLLARIAEDEAVARQAPIDARRVSNDLGRSNPWEAEVTTDETWGANGEVSLTAARMLAECEANRRIVRTHETHCVGYHDWPLTDVHPERADRAGVDVGLWHALRLLAIPYADHPDYDEAWRP